MHKISNDKNEISSDLIKFLNESEKISALINAKTVVIKPNLSGRMKEGWNSNARTDRTLLKTVVDLVLKLNTSCTIYIAESDSIYNSRAYMKFEKLNLPNCLNIKQKDLSRVHTLDITRDKYVLVENPEFMYFNKRNGFMKMSEIISSTDFIISLANIKTHVLSTYSGTCKNLFGMLPDMNKSYYHTELDKVIHDINIAIKPDINIIDGFKAMQGNGPIRGDLVDCGFRFISDNNVEADFYTAAIVGIDTKRVKYLKYLAGSETIYTPEAKWKFTKPDLYLRIKFYIKRLLLKTVNKLLKLGSK